MITVVTDTLAIPTCGECVLTNTAVQSNEKSSSHKFILKRASRLDEITAVRDTGVDLGENMFRYFFLSFLHQNS
jgi:hypothetical protein